MRMKKEMKNQNKTKQKQQGNNKIMKRTREETRQRQTMVLQCILNQMIECLLKAFSTKKKKKQRRSFREYDNNEQKAIPCRTGRRNEEKIGGVKESFHSELWEVCDVQ